MQKKLLFMSVVIITTSLCSEDTSMPEQKEPKVSLEEKELNEFIESWEKVHGTKKENLEKYTREITKEYESALAQSCQDTEAINKKHQEIETRNDKEEQRRSRLIDDSASGYFSWGGLFSTAASKNSVKGSLQTWEQEYKEEKNNINARYKTTFTTHKKLFDEHVYPFMVKKLNDRRYMLYDHYLIGLKECGNNQEGLSYHHVDWNNVSQPDFLNKMCAVMYDEIHKHVHTYGIPLTREQVIAFAMTIKLDDQYNPNDLKGKTLVEQIEIGKARVKEEIDLIRNPEKRIHKEDSLDKDKDDLNKDTVS